ncbi:hypothetical protein [Pedobacter frigidisoli]|uniref:hypothetical protein n=1 Tax=Pedobacter frigidisoli TaxID=2530455 RepID=UPI0029305906|nr:hypothetical protein [Pedobacter frigidisoli]
MKHLLLLLAACLAACTTLRKDAANASLTASSNLQTELTATRQWTVMRNDSSDSELQWRIWPKGIVFYSPDSGFKGEVEMMELWKRDSRKVETKAAGLAMVTQKQQAQQSVKEKKAAASSAKVRVTWWYWVMGGLVLAAWLWWKVGR